MFQNVSEGKNGLKSYVISPALFQLPKKPENSERSDKLTFDTDLI